MTNYDEVTNIINELRYRLPRSSNNINEIVRDICDDEKLKRPESGSGRLVIVLKEQGIVIKIPYNYGGLRQNNNEVNDVVDGYAKTIESHTLFDRKDFLIVCEYCEPIQHELDRIISHYQTIINRQQKTPRRLLNKILAKPLETHHHLIAQLVYDEVKDINDVDESAQYNIDRISSRLDYLSSDYLEDELTEAYNEIYEHEYIDNNPDNFAISSEGELVMLDGGIKSRSELCECIENTKNINSNSLGIKRIKK